jgi:hypothetical protein
LEIYSAVAAVRCAELVAAFVEVAADLVRYLVDTAAAEIAQETLLGAWLLGGVDVLGPEGLGLGCGVLGEAGRNERKADGQSEPERLLRSLHD